MLLKHGGSLTSILSISRLNRLKILPMGVTSKNATGQRNALKRSELWSTCDPLTFLSAEIRSIMMKSRAKHKENIPLNDQKLAELLKTNNQQHGT